MGDCLIKRACEYSVSSFIIARNEEDNLCKTIDSIKRQTQRVHPIVVVDDGSIDTTPTIAVKKGCQLVSLPYHEESYVGTVSYTHLTLPTILLV